MLSLVLTLGCAASRHGTPGAAKTASGADGNGLDATIGSLAEAFASDAIPVKGYSLVGGLAGSGSSECPPQIRAYLEKYILQHLSGTKVKIDELINSPDTAVVVVEGVIPPAAAKNQKFDVRVTALPNTQTNSLMDGSLYDADLYEARQFGATIYTLANAGGPVFVDLINPDVDLRSGYVLGGGGVTEEFKINLTIRRPDYRIAGQIRDRINGRFGPQTALAMAPGTINLEVPAKYANQKYRFLQLVRTTYFTETPQLTQKRILFHVGKLASSPDKNTHEIALEAIGSEALPKLAVLLNSGEPEVRLRAARCMFNLSDDRGFEVLRGIATDKSSSYQIDAINTLAYYASNPQVSSLLGTLLRDDNWAVRLAAYENLVSFASAVIPTELIANNFHLDQIPAPSGQPGIKASRNGIFVSRRNQPRVALFGAPIYCRENVFIETPDKSITINIPAGERWATVIRKHPKRPDVIIQLKSTLDLADIIQTLCREPAASPQQGGPGLGVSYSALVALLKQMADSGAVDAEFHAGPLPFIKK